MTAYILFEHAAGYALFKNIAMEDIGSQLDQVFYSFFLALARQMNGFRNVHYVTLASFFWSDQVDYFLLTILKIINGSREKLRAVQVYASR